MAEVVSLSAVWCTTSRAEKPPSAGLWSSCLSRRPDTAAAKTAGPSRYRLMSFSRFWFDIVIHREYAGHLRHGGLPDRRAFRAVVSASAIIPRSGAHRSTSPFRILIACYGY